MGAYEFAWVYIGDFDGHCDVGFGDWAIFALAWLTEQGDGQYNPDCDISLPADNKIDWADVKILCDNWLAGSVTNIDDLAGYTVSAISGDTTEAGGTATFTVVLNSQPTANVTVNFDTSDPSEGTVSSTSKVFTTANWNAPQTVTVTGQDDPVQDGDQPYSIVFSPSTSADPSYNGTTPAPNVAVTNVEAGTDGTIDIIQGSFTPGWAILVRVLLDTDEYANATSGAGNDAITVTVSSNITGDSETITLRESTTTAGDFDCTIEGCIVNTQDSGTPVAADSLLQVTAGEVVTVTYIDAVRSDGSLSFPVSATITAGPSSCVRITINEVVTEGVIDWSDSSGGDGIKFNNIPGTDPGNHHDEWFEFYNSGTCAVDLTGYKLRIIDGSDYLFEWNITPSQEKQTLVFLSGGSSTNFLIGEYHILGQPSGNAEDETGKTSDDVWLRLEGPDGSILDEVAIGTSVGGDGDNTNNAPPGPAAGPNDESARRCPNLTDTNVDNADWFRSTAGATIVGANPGAPCP
jgi:hypothetical protein